MCTNVYLIIVFYIYVCTCVNIYTLHAIALGFIRQAATFFFRPAVPFRNHQGPGETPRSDRTKAVPHDVW